MSCSRVGASRTSVNKKGNSNNSNNGSNNNGSSNSSSTSATTQGGGTSCSENYRSQSVRKERFRTARSSKRTQSNQSISRHGTSSSSSHHLHGKGSRPSSSSHNDDRSSKTSGNSNEEASRSESKQKHSTSDCSESATVDNELRDTFQRDPKMVALFAKKKYKPIKILGRGSYGQVYKGIKVDTGEFVAIKVVQMAKLGPIFREKYLPQELAALIYTKHDNVVRTIDIIRADEKLFVFMEFCPNGDIRGYLARCGAIGEKLPQYWFGQIVAALAYLHRHLRMAHRDMKLENVLLDSRYDTKLADFGFAKEIWDSSRHCVIMSKTICGTLAYFSPQLLQQMPYNGFAADAWACGVMLFVLLNLQYPFSQKKPEDMKIALLEMTNYPTYLRSKFVPTISSNAIDLTLQLLNPDEMARMSLHQALRHEWLSVPVERSVAFASVANLQHSKSGSQSSTSNTTNQQQSQHQQQSSNSYQSFSANTTKKTSSKRVSGSEPKRKSKKTVSS